MYSKTTSINFKPYGQTFSEVTERKKHHRNNRSILLNSRNHQSVSGMFLAKEDLYLRVEEGIVLLIVTNDINKGKIEPFVIHQVVQIYRNNYYNFVTITDKAKIEISSLNDKEDCYFPLKEPYYYQKIKSDLQVKEIFSYYYVVRNTNYTFPGEKHHYFELTMVDTGVLHTSIDDKDYTLSSNQLIFYTPDQFHTQYTGDDETCSYLTILFDMDILDVSEIQNKIFTLDRNCHNLMDEFLKNSREDNPHYHNLLITDLQKIILTLLRNCHQKQEILPSTPMQQKFENELLDGILNYISENIYAPLTVEELCKRFSISRSSLQSLFQKYLHTAPKQYISSMKLEHSKKLIKESTYTISEISSICGFTSIHYFSRRFKKEYGIAPTVYAKSFLE